MIYLLDTNVISDLFKKNPIVREHIKHNKDGGHQLTVCPPVYYELRRGLLKRKAIRKLASLQTEILPRFEWVPLNDDDWEQAAQFWAEAVRGGKQLSTVDLLIAGLAHRLDAIIASSDADFDALPVKREDWRLPLPD